MKIKEFKYSDWILPKIKNKGTMFFLSAYKSGKKKGQLKNVKWIKLPYPK